MMPNCLGCEIELKEAYIAQEDGFFVATTVDRDSSSNIGHKGHYGMIIVNDQGKIIYD